MSNCDLIVGHGDVVVRSGLVTDYAWRKAMREGRLKPLRPKFEYKRLKYLASHVERVFGLPAGCFCDHSVVAEGSVKGE